MRGKVLLFSSRFPVVGITPACAGKRGCQHLSGAHIEDHPRVCGEKALSTFSSRKNSGSPPRVRGKGSDGRGAGDVEGITPAYAGKSCRRCPQRSRSRDHPRVCGEKRKTGAVPAPLPGSPPRMRGKEPASCAQVLRQGITPACAGKRPSRCLRRSAGWDHPRVCGEKLT